MSADQHPQWTTAVLDDLQRHVFHQAETESVGVLVGRRNGNTQTQVTAFIPIAQATVPGQRAVLSHEGISYAHQLMAEHYRAEQMVGWYLSRPDGAFLTSHDTAAHLQFFGREDQIALVVDPRTALGAVYAVRNGHLDLIYSGQISKPDGPQLEPAPAHDEHGTPWAGYAVLALMGFALGAAAWLTAVAVGLL